MDNVTHALTGIALSRAGLNRVTPEATLLLILASNAADLDIVTMLFGATTYLDLHRGPTHSLIALPLMALLPVVLVRWGLRRPLPWLRAWLVCLLGASVHLGMDYLTAYGTRPFWPFASGWTQWPVFFIADAFVIAAMLLAVAAPALSSLVSGEIGARRSTGQGWAIAALIFLVGWIGFRGMMHDRAEQILQARVYQGRPPLRVMALPNALSPMRWRGLVECEGFFSEHDVHVWQEFDPDAGEIMMQPRQTEILAAARRAPLMKRFLDFAQWPSWRVVPKDRPEGAVEVRVRDLRFSSGFEASVDLDQNLRVLDESTSAGGMRDNSRR